MGGRSSSSTQQVSNQFDQRQVNTWNTTTNNSQRYDISTSDDHRINVADDHRVNLNDNHSFALDGGSVYAGAGANVSTTDFGAVRDSFGFGEQLAKLFGSQASRTLDTADSAIAAGGRTAGQAFDFAGTASSSAFDFGTQLAKLFGNQSNSASSRVLDTADASIASSGKTAGQAFDLARYLTDSTAGKLTDASAKITGQAFDYADSLAGSSIAGANKSTGQAFDFAGGLTDKAIGFLGDVFKQQTNANAQTQSLTAAAYNDAKGRGAMTDTILMVTVGGALLVAFFALRK